MNAMWITRLNITFPTEATAAVPASGSTPAKPARPAMNGFLLADLKPYDGAGNLLALGGKSVSIRDLAVKRAADPIFDGMINSIVLVLKAKANNPSNPRAIMVMASDPANPVQAIVHFEGGQMFRVANCFAEAAQDAQFGAALIGIIAEIGRQAQLTVQ